jgi:transcriptional regulator with XRE-family HTH domain
MVSTHEVTVRAHQIGLELRRLREECGLSTIQVASRIDVSNSKISRIETGRCVPPYEDVVGLLAIYGVTGAERRDLLALASESKRTGWWQKSSVPLYERIHTLQTLESTAVSITNYEPEFIPGLLQTVPYMQATMREVAKLTDDEMVDRIAARMRRQQVLRRRPEYTAIIAESVLHQCIGGPEVMHGQLTYLLEAATKRYITIRVVPNSIGGHLGLSGSFIRLRFGNRSDVVVEETRSSNLFLEDPDDLAYYDQTETDVLTVALDEGLSLELIEGAARNRDQEASWHDLSRPEHPDLA